MAWGLRSAPAVSAGKPRFIGGPTPEAIYIRAPPRMGCEPLPSPWYKAAVRHLFAAVILMLVAGECAAATGLCYSPESRSIRVAPDGPRIAPGGLRVGPAPTSQRRNERHLLAFKASSLVYKWADLENSRTGQDFLETHAAFMSGIPPGYQYEHGMGDRRSGFKYVILSPTAPDMPWIFAIAGTESALDWAVDIANFGRVQLHRLRSLSLVFTNCEFTDSRGRPKGALDWIITGHSLGGGLAQAFAYHVQDQRRSMALRPANLELVTYNGFGARELVGLGEPDRIEHSIRSFNYFVTGDVVSTVGRHIGSTYEVKASGPITPLTGIRRHTLQAIWRAAVRDGQPRFADASPAQPPYSKPLNLLKRFGHMLYMVPDAIVDTTVARAQSADVLEQATAIIAARKGSAPYDREALTAMDNLAMYYTDELQTYTSGRMPLEVYERMQRVSERIAKLTVKLDGSKGR